MTVWSLQSQLMTRGFMSPVCAFSRGEAVKKTRAGIPVATGSLKISDRGPVQGVHVPFPHVIQQHPALPLDAISQSVVVHPTHKLCATNNDISTLWRWVSLSVHDMTDSNGRQQCNAAGHTHAL